MAEPAARRAGSTGRPRRAFRARVVQILYAAEVSGHEPERAAELYYAVHHRAGDRPQVESYLRGIHGGLGRIDEEIRVASRRWRVRRLNAVDRAILRLAVHEMLGTPEVPVRVVINEAVELAKVFSGEEAPGFINAVLDTVARNLKRLEAEA